MKKHFFSFFFILMFFFNFNTSYAFSILPCSLQGISPGDVDLDGKITNNDASLIAQKTVDPSVSLISSLNADVNADGKVDITDALFIAQYVDGSRSTFPLCSTNSRQSPCKGSIMAPGDVNQDGIITFNDALAVAKHTVNIIDLTSMPKINADVNADGKVDITDALFIAQYMVGFINTFSSCSYSNKPLVCGSLGDVDSSNGLSLDDAFMIAQYNVKSRTLTSTQLSVADVNADGKVDGVDAIFIAQYVDGRITTFSGCPVSLKDCDACNVYDCSAHAYLDDEYFGGPHVDGSNLPAYRYSNVPWWSNCNDLEYRTCNNGVWSSGNGYTQPSCVVATALSCTLPTTLGGGSISHGTDITAYEYSSVPYSSSCTSETRTCINGVLSGTYLHPSCSMAAITPPPACIPSTCPSGCAAEGQSRGCGLVCPNNNGASCGTNIISCTSGCSGSTYNTYPATASCTQSCGGGSCGSCTPTCSPSSSTADNAAPTTSITINPTSPNGNNGWYTSNVVVTLSCTDSNSNGCTPSGCASTSYRIGGVGAFQTYSAPITITTEGLNNLEYKSTDATGNTETTKTQTIKLDKTKPSVTTEALPNLVASKETVKINTDCIDDDSGCNTATVIADTYSCDIDYTMGETDCNITLTSSCELKTYNYQITTNDTAGHTNTTTGVFDVYKNDGCGCVFSNECLSGTCITSNICSVLYPPELSVSIGGQTTDTVTALFSEKTIMYFNVKNPLGITDIIELNVYTNPNQLRYWSYFEGQEYGHRTNKLISLGSNSELAVPFVVFGGKYGSYDLNIMVKSQITNQITRKTINLNVVDVDENGNAVVSNVPGLSFLSVLTVLFFGLLLAGGKKHYM